jgi:BirA family biotin operon repressor/biotin-[acetyl-CoA-carboxylase] ligase
MSTVLPAGPARPWLPLLVGLATAQAIEDASEGGAVGIKWPNDLVLGGRKLAGVLCEASGSAVVAGIGVNVNEPEGGFPKPLATVATALDMEGFKLLSRSDLAGMILGALEARLGGARTVLDDATLAELSARDVLYGRAVESEERGRGTARGIAPDGSLMLERPNGSTVPVTSGSVRFRST